MYLSKGGIHGYIGYPPKSATELGYRRGGGDPEGRERQPAVVSWTDGQGGGDLLFV